MTARYPSSTIYPSTTIYPCSTYDLLVYDRTQADVDYLFELKDKVIDGTATESELVEWNMAMLKGAMNASDLNRIGDALKRVKKDAEDNGFTITYPYSIVNDYSKTSLPTALAVAQLIENVLVVKTAFSKWIATTVPSNLKTYENANAVEYILYQVRDILGGTEFAYRYSGDFIYAGGSY